MKEKLSPNKIIIHGRSLGGHVAKFLSNQADIVVTDRTFSSISNLHLNLTKKAISQNINLEIWHRKYSIISWIILTTITQDT